MQHADHDEIGGTVIGEWKPLGIRHAIEPRRVLNVSRDHFGQPTLEIANAAADLDRKTAAARGCDAIVEILVDDAQHALAFPDAAVFRELIGGRALHHIALMRMNANNTMRSRMMPWRKREICVSPYVRLA